MLHRRVLFIGWNIRGYKFLWFKWFPVKACEPRMSFEFGDSILKTNTVMRFSLEALSDEISSLNAPPIWDFFFGELYIFCAYSFINFSLVLSNIRSSSFHAFVAYYSQGEVISGKTMILSLHHLGCHVTWSPRIINSIIRGPLTSDTEISYS